MLALDILEKLKNENRTLKVATGGEDSLGPLKHLVGEWNNKKLKGHGWNMIALPFQNKDGGEFDFNYRLLLNQYDETLQFGLVANKVPNRGIEPSDARGPVQETDQFLAALDYQQVIEQIAAQDFPKTNLIGEPNDVIHHEPGLWLHMANLTTNGLDIARLSTIPHGDSVLALGTYAHAKGGPKIPDISGLPIGVDQNLDSKYLVPYKHFHDHPFENLFDPTIPNELLKKANQGVDILSTTTLEVDTTLETGGITNIPFIVKQANAAEMKSTFWIQEVKTDEGIEWRLQYSQIVILDFFGRTDGMPGLIRWPHISINTMTKAKDRAEQRYTP